jgi:hypothetical protein
MKFYIVEINEARRKRASSLKTYRVQDQLVLVKFGASCKNPFLKNIETGPVVLQYHYRLGFKMIFVLVIYLLVPRTYVPKFRNFFLEEKC